MQSNIFLKSLWEKFCRKVKSFLTLFGESLVAKFYEA